MRDYSWPHIAIRLQYGPPRPDPGINHEVDPDFLEHHRREAIEQPELPWEA